VPCDPCSLATESVEPANEKSTCSAAEKVKSGDAATDTAEISNPPSLVDLAAQCVGGDCVKRRAWADSPMEPAAVQITSGSCYELDPTPQEAAAAEAAAAATAAAATFKLISSDSGGEDSAKENKESSTDRSDSSRSARKKGRLL